MGSNKPATALAWSCCKSSTAYPAADCFIIGAWQGTEQCPWEHEVWVPVGEPKLSTWVLPVSTCLLTVDIALG
ncbi:hypothetical protein ACRRTK_008996 [Alexandromys fortis]